VKDTDKQLRELGAMQARMEMEKRPAVKGCYWIQGYAWIMIDGAASRYWPPEPKDPAYNVWRRIRDHTQICQPVSETFGIGEVKHLMLVREPGSFERALRMVFSDWFVSLMYKTEIWSDFENRDTRRPMATESK
jgi:hypothetical protein